jgi:transcription initiation factor TFIIIB Brf1 subunit/transcription initiation factor TFIIB
MSDQWNPKCPACKTDRWVSAELVIPRLEQGLRVCIDCGCVFAALSRGQREYLVDSIAKRKREVPTDG